MEKGNIGIGVTNPKHQVEIKCDGCGNMSYIDTDFEINIIGMIQLRCKKCKTVMNVPDIAWPKVKISNGPDNVLRITAEGNVGI